MSADEQEISAAPECEREKAEEGGMEFKGVGRLVATLVLSGICGGVGIVWKSAEQANARAAALEADQRVLRAEIQGRLDRMADEQARTREEMQRLTRAVEDLTGRKR